MNTPHYQTASDAFDSWHREVITGTAPTFYPVGDGELARIEIGPNLVTLIGGAPGAGKTAFTMQCAVDALRLNTSLRVLICNIEMTPQVLLDRQLARLSGIDVSTIRYRKLDETHADRLDQALNTLESIADRLCFLQQPLNLANVAASADEFGAQLLVLDYIQRIPPPGEFGDRRGSIDATMNYLRKFASEGIAVMVVAAVARQKDKQGRSSLCRRRAFAGEFSRIVRTRIWGGRRLHPHARQRRDRPGHTAAPESAAHGTAGYRIAVRADVSEFYTDGRRRPRAAANRRTRG